LTPEEMALKDEYMEKRANKEMKAAVGLVYNTDKPQNAADGFTSGVGNILKGAGAGLAAIGAGTVVGAKT
jgi:hypothetical protein